MGDWSSDGSKLVFRGRQGTACDQVYSLRPFQSQPQPQRLSPVDGEATGGHFLPGDRETLFASTYLQHGGCGFRQSASEEPGLAAAPQRVPSSWPLPTGYELFRAGADPSHPVRLTDSAGYDAEPTVCAKDGSIVFTSARDGDLELYRIDKDGANLRRLTHSPGYDGGASFSADCTRLVWQAFRPKASELDGYKDQLHHGLLTPERLELYVANADGSEARQITYLGAVAFAPVFHPSSERILFSSNFHDPRGQEFDVFAVNADGTQLERVTHAAGFDGYAKFSPDGQFLAFSSERASGPGSSDILLFLAKWKEKRNEARANAESGGPIELKESAADRVLSDVRFLAKPAGGERGSRGLTEAGRYITERFELLGLKTIGSRDAGPFKQVRVVRSGAATELTLNATALPRSAFAPLPFSSEGRISGALVSVGYGISESALGWDDYADKIVEGKIVVVQGSLPPATSLSAADRARVSDLRYKAVQAREHGAKGLLVVDVATGQGGGNAELDSTEEGLIPRAYSMRSEDVGIVAAVVEPGAMSEVLEQFRRLQWSHGTVQVQLEEAPASILRVAARLEANVEAARVLPGSVVVGAQYQRVDRRRSRSAASGSASSSPGAYEDASGVAAMLEVARMAVADPERRRELTFVAFLTHRAGVADSARWVRSTSEGVGGIQAFALLNLDRVGQLTENRLVVSGSDSARTLTELFQPACDSAGVVCLSEPGNVGEYGSGTVATTPVLSFRAGTLLDKASSEFPERLNAAGAAQVARVVNNTLEALDEAE